MNKIDLNTGLAYLCQQRSIVAGVTVAYGDVHDARAVWRGNAQEVQLIQGKMTDAVRPIRRDSIFDLASVTKLFTGLAVLQLRERGRLRLTDAIGRYDSRFYQIADARIGELLSFRVPLQTPERVDAQPDRKSALRQLFAMERAPQPDIRYYTDMGAMVLKYVVEAASGQSFYEYLHANILAPLDMRATFSRVPEKYLDRTVCYNYERRLLNGRYCVDVACETGVAHDPKARILRNNGDDLCGHAGLFATVDDLIRLAQGLLDGAVISRETLLEMGKNRTGYPLPDGTYTQYLGYLCYAKHPDQTYSEVPACFGERTIALNGYTGNHFSVDPERGQFIILLANKVHNRITVANGRPDPFDTTEQMRWEDGNIYPVSQNYTYLKDRYLKEPIGELLNGNWKE